MTDACDMANFPQERYFRQHELSKEIPQGYNYEYTRCFVIRAHTNSSGALKDIKIWISSIMEEKPNWGTPKDSSPWRRKAEDLFSEQVIGPRNTLDFSVRAPSRVVIMLVGEFWKFSNGMDPITTKHNLEGMYFDLKRHKKNSLGEVVDIPTTEECRCISFYTAAPCDYNKGVRHGFSLNVDLLVEIETSGGGKEVVPLPITLDPDIENKGGEP